MFVGMSKFNQSILNRIVWAIRDLTDSQTFAKGKKLADINKIQSGEFDSSNFRFRLKIASRLYTVQAGVESDQVYYKCSCKNQGGQLYRPCEHIVALGAYLFRFQEIVTQLKTIKYKPDGIENDGAQDVISQRTTQYFSLTIRSDTKKTLKALQVPDKPDKEWKFLINHQYYTILIQLIHQLEPTKSFRVLSEVNSRSIMVFCNCKEPKNPICIHEKNTISLLMMEGGLFENNTLENKLLNDLSDKLSISPYDLQELASLVFEDGEFLIKLNNPEKLEKKLPTHSNYLQRRILPRPSIELELDLVWLWRNLGNNEFRPRLMLAESYKNKVKGYKKFRDIRPDEFNLFDAQKKSGIEFQELLMTSQLDAVQMYRFFLYRLKETSTDIQHFVELNGRGHGNHQNYLVNEFKLDSKLSLKFKEVGDFSISMLCIDNKAVNPKKVIRIGYSIFYDSVNFTMHLLDPHQWDWILDHLSQNLSVLFYTNSESHKEFQLTEQKLKPFLSKKTKPKIPEARDLTIELYLDMAEGSYFNLTAKTNLPNDEELLVDPKVDVLKAIEYYSGMITPEEVLHLKNCWQKLTSLHPILESQIMYEQLILSVKLPDIFELLESIFQLAETEGWKVFGRDNIMVKIPRPVVPRIYSRLFTANEWFSMEIEMKFDKEVFSTKRILEALAGGKKFVLLKDGRTGEIPEKWLKQFARYAKISGNAEGQIHKALAHAIHLSDFDEVGGDAIHFVESMKTKLGASENFKTQKLPKSLKASLRPYQLAAYQWMHELSHYGWGGVLADDMGLGKTLQAISYILSCIENKKGPHLIIVPKSLLHNWESEWLNFSNKKPYLHTGNERTAELKELKNKDIIITSYGIVLRDIDILKEINFDTVIFDEAQAVKNPTAKTRKAIALIKSRFRLAMTGTPVENDLSDLFSIMSLANPGILGNLHSFQTRFKRDDKEGLQILREMIHPFMLRRLKSQVATDLPERLVINRIIDMDEDQALVYETRRRFYHDLFQEKSQIETEWKKSSFLVLKGMNELRQICNSPSLIEGETGLGSKITELLDELEELLPNHKVLIFSQYVKMLNLVSHELEKKGWKYVQLDGKTKDRKEKVQQFQEDKDTRIFLISLKAGGTGLNLTEAEYVFLLDPWWNPAAENQAIDRAHRIGQENKVIALKYVCKGSIEEKVLALQDIKKNLVDSVIEVDEEVVKTLDKKRILELFSS